VFLLLAIPIAEAAVGIAARYVITTAVRVAASAAVRAVAARTAAVAASRIAGQAALRSGQFWARTVILNPKAHIASGIAASANLGGQMVANHGWDPRQWSFDHVDWGAIAIDYTLGAGAFGLTAKAGAVLPSAVKTMITGSGSRLTAAAVFTKATGQIAMVQTGAGAVRSISFGTDCFNQWKTAVVQTPAIGFRKAMIEALFSRVGGLNSVPGAVVDGMWNATQEIVLRQAFESNPGQGDGTSTCSVQVQDAAGAVVQAVGNVIGDDEKIDVQITRPAQGRVPGHGDTYRFQRFLQERSFYGGMLNGERTPETIRAANEYAKATGLNPPNLGAWSTDTQRAFLRLQVAGWLDPIPGEVPLSPQERMRRTQAKGALETLQLMPGSH
jgi:hypothetical protein